MKTTFKILVLFIIFSLNLSAQTRYTEEEFNGLICKKWKLKEVEMGKMKVPASQLGENIMVFNPDGTYEVTEQGDTYSGEWSFDSTNQMLVTVDKGGKDSNKLIELTEYQLVIEMKDSQEVIKMKFKAI